jgi:hypothetical protein
MFRGSKAGTLPSSTLIVRPIGDIAWAEGIDTSIGRDLGSSCARAFMD